MSTRSTPHHLVPRLPAPRLLPLPLLPLLLLVGCPDDPPPPAIGTSTGPGTSTTSTTADSLDDTGIDLQHPPQSDQGVLGATCDAHDPLRQLYWGDLHVHTGYSFDAWLHDVRTDPDQAYRFAKGEAIGLPPLDARGQPTQTVQLDRPLDFVAVTDHSEFLAEVQACTTPGTTAYDSTLCTDYRANQNGALVNFGLQLGQPSPTRFAPICEDGGVDCTALVEEVWQRTIDAAQTHHDSTSACTFTAFVGYEWSGMQALSNLHRNVIFRNDSVPAIPLSYYEAPSAQALWDGLRAQCLDGLDGCDVLAIPHNSNWSNGRLFRVEYPGAGSEAEQAAARAAMEPLVEVFQHKGDSECSNGLSGILGAPDELCEFEKLRVPPFEDCLDGIGSNGMVGGGCVSRRDFVRGALLEGLQEQVRIGVNPFRLGFIASTDTHNGTPGLVDEDAFVGHVGREDGDAIARLTGQVPAGPRNGPGGLVAVWAAENSRDAIFEALRRRETYGTSGPRMAVRVFGGASLPQDLCEQADLVGVADATGVPMGGQLPTNDEGPPRIAISALRDPQGLPLQRAQVIKGWIDRSGLAHVEVFDAVGGDNGASVDPLTCEPQGAGEDSLCTVWTDPAFDPGVPAYYYVRVLENPRCRWSVADCQSLGAMAPTVCNELPTAIQERAWTSPIWYEP
ncbi:DUF3604 domain-containing protein [Paraliomyxa miuraensis]|uniref:DUF3604 domain-containing protein n=1 Tax=Paraliomyxa miuraensis TaxID=376150 RepID=UPI00224FFF18|nr:DUF3604 domain-containing protein [Paraliomyxa miuraensis]MCX4240035.1 DUF3604 domain-containing protein [Paraliomyxa miuraensis]